MRFSIPEMNMEALEKKMLKIKKKCEKYGCEFRFERVGEHFDDVEIDGETETIRYIDVEAEGTAIVNGWRFAASLEYTDKGNIISRVGDIEVPDRYYKCAPWCEHCKTARDRKYSYIVYNEESGEFKQVGKSCLRDFTGGLSAEWVANWESFLKECEDATEVGGFGGGCPSYFKVDDFMAVAAETIRIYGYCKRGFEGVSTAGRAEDFYRVENGMYLGMCSKEIHEMYEEAKAKGFDSERAESVELAAKVREWIKGNERSDNYFHNLKVACSLDYVGGGNLGLLVSAFPAYNRELEYEAERREREAKMKEDAARSSWMGNVGDKVKFEIADFSVISSWETQWGLTSVYKLTDKNGLVATWKTSGWLNSECIGKVISGTVKEQKEYRGVKQTELTRCRVTDIPKKWNDEAQKAFEEAFYGEDAATA